MPSITSRPPILAPAFTARANFSLTAFEINSRPQNNLLQMFQVDTFLRGTFVLVFKFCWVIVNVTCLTFERGISVFIAESSYSFDIDHHRITRFNRGCFAMHISFGWLWHALMNKTRMNVDCRVLDRGGRYFTEDFATWQISQALLCNMILQLMWKSLWVCRLHSENLTINVRDI